MQPLSKQPSYRRYSYFIFLICVQTLWLFYMYLQNAWSLFHSSWPATLTMTVGSFVAGATAEGGAFVAFPVFTKVLAVPPANAATFGLMIQSIGMTSATIAIYAMHVRVLTRVIRWVLAGALVGIALGIHCVALAPNVPKVIFTAIVVSFAIALAINRWIYNKEPVQQIKAWTQRTSLLFCFVGLLGGLSASQTGTGTNIFTFVVLTLAFGIDEKIAVPTSVVCMAINSVCGFAINAAAGNVAAVWDYWLAAIPVVVLGAPLGAYFASRVHRDWLIYLLLFLIAIEFITTLLFVTLSAFTIALFLAVLLISCQLYYALLKQQHN